MPNLDKTVFLTLLQKYARTDDVSDDRILFGGGLDLSSIAFTEFIMDLEETADTEINIDALDASVRTVGQLWARLGA
jgi:acyl carrier protein